MDLIESCAEACKYTIQYLMSGRKGGHVRTLREQIVTANLLLEGER